MTRHDDQYPHGEPQDGDRGRTGGRRDDGRDYIRDEDQGRRWMTTEMRMRNEKLCMKELRMKTGMRMRLRGFGTQRHDDEG